MSRIRQEVRYLSYLDVPFAAISSPMRLVRTSITYVGNLNSRRRSAGSLLFLPDMRGLTSSVSGSKGIRKKWELKSQDNDVGIGFIFP